MPTSHRTSPEELLELQELLSPAAALTDIDGRREGLQVRHGRAPRGLLRLLRRGCRPTSSRTPNIINASGGTTGKPKLIKQNIPCGHSDGSIGSWFQVSGMAMDQTQLLAGALFHGAPHIAAMNGLFSGGTLVIPSTFCPEGLVECIEKYKVQFMQTVPTLMHRIIKTPASRRRASPP